MRFLERWFRRGTRSCEVVEAGSKILAVAISPDGKTVATGSGGGDVTLWDTSDRRCMARLRGHSDTVRGVVFSPDGDLVASTSLDGSVMLWSVHDASRQRTLPFGKDQGYAVAFSPDGKLLAAGGWEQVKVWEVATGTLLRTLPGHERFVHSVAFSNDGRIFASAGADGTVRLWDVRTFECLRAIEPGGDIFSVAFSPDGKRLAAGGHHGMTQFIVVWVANSNAVLWRQDRKAGCYGDPKGYTICSVAFSTDSKTLASASDDGAVTLWKVRNGEELQRLVRHKGECLSVAFFPDGKSLVSGGTDSTVRFWSV